MYRSLLHHSVSSSVHLFRFIICTSSTRSSTPACVFHSCFINCTFDVLNIRPNKFSFCSITFAQCSFLPPPLRFPHSMRTRIRNTFAPFVGFRSAMCIKICHFLTKINSKLGLAPYQKIFRVFPDPFSTPNLKMKLYP